MVTPADFAVLQQQLKQEVTDVMQQLRAEVNDSISGRMDMLNSINTALQNVSARQQKTSRIESATSSQEIGKATTKKESSGASCQTCTCGCKHGQTKERRCLSSSKASTSWTTMRLRLIFQMTSSDRLRHRFVKSYTEPHQTSR